MRGQAVKAADARARLPYHAATGGTCPPSLAPGVPMPLASPFRLAPLLLAALLIGAGLAAPARAEPADVTVCFSPPKPEACDPLALILSEIDHAKRFIHVFAFAMTSRPIARALLRAHKRGVEVEILFDQDAMAGKYSDLPVELRAAGVPIRSDPAIPALMHDKIMVIDGETVLTGSYNWTYSAEEKNAENEVRLRSPTLAAQYEAEFQFLYRGGW